MNKEDVHDTCTIDIVKNIEFQIKSFQIHLLIFT